MVAHNKGVQKARHLGIHKRSIDREMIDSGSSMHGHFQIKGHHHHLIPREQPYVLSFLSS